MLSCSVHNSGDMPGNRMNSAPRWRAGGPPRRGLIHSTLDPYVGLAAVPIGERADAVAGAEHIIQAIFQDLKRNTEVNLLRHLVRRFDFQRQLGHDAQSSKRDNRTQEMVSIDIGLQLNQVAFGGDELES